MRHPPFHSLRCKAFIALVEKVCYGIFYIVPISEVADIELDDIKLVSLDEVIKLHARPDVCKRAHNGLRDFAPQDTKSLDMKSFIENNKYKQALNILRVMLTN